MVPPPLRKLLKVNFSSILARFVPIKAEARATLAAAHARL
jgi:hypothetical protein